MYIQIFIPVKASFFLNRIQQFGLIIKEMNKPNIVLIKRIFKQDRCSDKIN